MFESIKTFFADFFDYSSHDSTEDSAWSPDPLSNDNVNSDMSEPDFQSAFGTGADFIVPSEADSAFPSFDYTETTYGPDPSSSQDDWNW
jgi:hypothetical protein